MLTKALFIWSKIQSNQWYFEIVLQFKIAGFYFYKFKKVIYLCDGKAE